MRFLVDVDLSCLDPLTGPPWFGLGEGNGLWSIARDGFLEMGARAGHAGGFLARVCSTFV